MKAYSRSPLARAAALAIGCGIASLAPLAHAQSNVTLYGIVDGGIGYASNVASVTKAGAAGRPAVMSGASNTAFQSGTWQGSRWGLQGTEDLGGGLKALFRLENGFSLANGTASQNGAEFGRHAYVGLQDQKLGTITIGRQYDPLIDLVGSVGGTALLSGVAAHPGDVDNLDHSSRVNNSVKYRSPTWAGFTFGAMYGFGGQAGTMGRQNTWGLAGQYAGGPLVWGLAYSHANNDKASATDTTIGSWAGSSESAFGSSINAGYASAKSRDIIATAMTYQIGNNTTLGANYSHTEYSPGTYSRFTRTAKFDTVGVLAMYRFTNAFRLGGGYSFTNVNAPAAYASGAKYHQFNLAAFYNLSKRTELYALVGYQKASGATLDAFGNVIDATASVGDAANGMSSATNTQTIVRLGVSHVF
ncbi:porin [Pandoraea iniqua]|uniref:Porin n=1 Tax=Pandoraea iniqua TaxID=2508288 RepID=A0A5E4UET1_9BURK|nr:porin [Pandoraea iniqua]VVD98566.1 porin [Pandoraea iniqua]